MKIKCKRCEKKFKVTSSTPVVCDLPNCEVKYDMRGEVINFKEFKLPGKPPEYISKFNTPAPTYKEYTEAEWMQLCMSEGGDGVLCPI